MSSNAAPLDADAIQAFLDLLDETGERLREVLDAETVEDSPAIQFYLEGAAFLEAGYLMVEQLAPDFPGVFRALHDLHYLPLFESARRGQTGWGEALGGLPQFLRDYATAKVHDDLLAGEGPEA